MTMTSYQVETFGTPLAQKLREVPQAQGREVVLRIGSCGVCHSDVHLHDGYFDLGGGNKLDMTRTVNPPRTLGHEIAGTVVAVGPDAQGVSVGEGRVGGVDHLHPRVQRDAEDEAEVGRVGRTIEHHA